MLVNQFWLRKSDWLFRHHQSRPLLRTFRPSIFAILILPIIENLIVHRLRLTSGFEVKLSVVLADVVFLCPPGGWRHSYSGRSLRGITARVPISISQEHRMMDGKSA
jgi:hypothetical protein